MKTSKRDRQGSAATTGVVLGMMAAAAVWLLVGGSAEAAIVVRSTDSNYDSGTGDPTHTISGFTVDPRSGGKLVVIASWEQGNTAISATWKGTESLTVAVNSAGGRNSAILYLDNPTPGTGNIVVTFGANTASRVGVMHLTGATDGIHVTSTAGGLSGSLTTTAADTLVVGVYTVNGGGTITTPFSTQLYNGDSGSSRGSAGYQFEAAAGFKSYTWTDTNPTGNNNALAAFAPNPDPIISVLNSDWKIVQDTGSPGPNNLEANPVTLSFDAGLTADKLIVSLGSEAGSGGPPVITYNGVALTMAAGTAGGRNRGIWYLDKPYNGGAANLVVDMTSFGVVNGVGFAVVSISGAESGVAASTSASLDSVTITPTVGGSFVMAGCAANGGTPSAPAPLTQVYAGDVGSAQGTAGYINDVTAASQTYLLFTGSGQVSCAAAFSPLITQGTLFVLK